MKIVIKKINFQPYLYLVPALTLFILFLLFPIFFGLYLSFQKWDIVNKPEFIAFWNWGKVFLRTREFYKAFGNSLFFTGGAVVFQTTIGLFLAVGISRINHFRPVYRFVFFLPVVMSLVAAGILWYWMYNPTLGIINVLLKGMGLGVFARTWLGEAKTVMPSILIAAVWKWAGFTMMVYIAGMQGIPEELYEAADIEGASEIKKFLKITFPLLIPQTFINVMLTTIGSLKAFDWVFIMTGGGPGGASEVIPTLIYKTAFRFYRFGEAATMSMFLFILIFISSIILTRSFRRGA